MSRETQWAALRTLGLPEIGCAVVMGHAEAESNCEPNRVQGDFEISRSWSRTYTSMVDAGEISRDDFIFRGPGGGGYGWLQWTFSARKAGYYDNARKLGVSIGSQEAAISWFWEEVHKAEYKTVLDALMTGTDLRTVSDVFMKVFERPADMGEKACATRARMAQEMIDRFGGNPTPEPEPSPTPGARWDMKIAHIQVDMREDGYWPHEIDGLKTEKFIHALEEYVGDMKIC